MFPWEHASELEVLRYVVYFALSGCSNPDDSPIAQSGAGTRAFMEYASASLHQHSPANGHREYLHALEDTMGNKTKPQDACLYSDGLLMSSVFGQSIFAPAIRMERLIRC